MNETIRLNIGAGSTVIEGFTPIDRKLGSEAYPLPYADGSVTEIRASHILEHFSFAESQQALAEWIRVLRPGGRLRVAVPDLEKAAQADPDEWPFIVMGGQKDADDFHRSAWNKRRLQAHLEHFGLVNVREWESPNTDTAAHPCSLNLEGFKPAPVKPESLDLKIAAYMTLPRYEAVVARSVIEQALRPFGIGLNTSQGVYWGQCMQRMFEEALAKGVDWILSIDSDSLFTSKHLDALMGELANHPEIDSLAALQCRRGQPFPLMTVGKPGIENVEVDPSKPIKVTTAHFGLTLIRADVLRTVPKPWFFGQPDANGEWGDDKLDDDIWFWHQWRLAGKNIYVSPKVSIGHLEETVAEFDEHLQPRHIYIRQWREREIECKSS